MTRQPAFEMRAAGRAVGAVERRRFIFIASFSSLNFDRAFFTLK
jgi:hypothetical protein